MDVIHVKNTYRLAVAHKNCLSLSLARGCVTIASISFVIVVPLVFELRDALSAALRLPVADVMYALRMAAMTAAYRETEGLLWRSEYMGNCLVFLDCLG